MAAIEIYKAAGPDDFTAGRALLREYADWLAVDLCFQNFAEEVARLEEVYGPPGGALLLAAVPRGGGPGEEGGVAGCVGLRAIAGGFCELKRLYVRPSCRGRGIGRLLAAGAVDVARRLGYHRMFLDTIPARMPEATALYAAMGFRPAARYHENPLPGMEYLELALGR